MYIIQRQQGEDGPVEILMHTGVIDHPYRFVTNETKESWELPAEFPYRFNALHRMYICEAAEPNYNYDITEYLR